jgi:chromosomal replication initiation ATPase DnaA
VLQKMLAQPSGQPLLISPNSVGAQLADITAVAAAIFEVSISDIMSKTRTMHLVSARTAITVKARLLGIGYVTIARFLQRDHSSLVYLARQFENRMAQLPAQAALMAQVIEYEQIKLPTA